MHDYKVIPTGNRRFVLLRDEQSTAELKYQKWSAAKAEIILADGTLYNIKPKGFWQRTTEVLRDGIAVLTFKLTWRTLLINSPSDPLGQTYRLRHKGFWKSGYQLLGPAGEQMLVIESEFKWKGFKSEFQVLPSPLFEGLPNRDLLILTCICAINHQRKMAAVTAAT